MYKRQACGLLEIARFVPENEKKLYEDSAYRILRAMEEHFANWDEDADAILEMGKVAYHGDAGQEAIIYGDYFFIEAILRMLDKEDVYKRQLMRRYLSLLVYDCHLF